ncbi:MAG: lactonase family protein [Candidatus Obscuribacterales bacterium]|nr:lactonase family protein [Candidatus Obscuribacterales bacterium]
MKNFRILIALAFIFCALSSLPASLASASDQMKPPQKNTLVFFGTYTDGASKGIYTYKFDSKDGRLEPLSDTNGGIKNPSFLAIHPDGEFLYAVSEVGEIDGKPGGTLWAYSIDPETGKLSFINKQSTAGSGPCFVALDKTNKIALVANYDSGSVSSFALNADGSIAEASSQIQHKGSSIDPARQTAPHAHSINGSPDNRFALAADLGLDKILIYKLDQKTAQLKTGDKEFNKTPEGGGPRHLFFHPNGHYVYVCNEMQSSVSAYQYNAEDGSMSLLQTISTTPGEIAGNSTAEIQIHPSGKFAYCSNRGHDSIAIFKIDESTGKLTTIGHAKTMGKKPRHFCIDPSGSFIIACNQASNNVIVFKIDKTTGNLTQIGDTIELPSPVCVKFLEIGQ